MICSRRLEIYEKKLIEYEKAYIESQEKREDKLKNLKIFIEKCNIFEAYNLEYLKELKKKDDILFTTELKKYEDSICKEKLKKEFGIKKLSATDKIINLISEVSSFVYLNENELENEIKIFFSKIKEFHHKIYNLNFQILPLDNKELYLNIVYEILNTSIYNKIKNFENGDLEDFATRKDQIYTQKKLKEINQKIDESKKIKNRKSDEYKNLSENIQDEIEKLSIYNIVHNKQFKNYLKNMNLFYKRIINNIIRFIEQSIMDEENIKIFEKLIFFFGNYDFEDLMIYYINIFNESLNKLPLDYIKSKIEKTNEFLNLESKRFSLNNDNIEMKFMDTTFTITNYEEFSFEALMFFLSNKADLNPISNFELIKILKIQYLDKFINENILTKKWKNFFYQVFCSPTIFDLISKVYKYGKIILQKEYINLIDSVKFFNFNTSFLGVTFSIYQVFVSGFMKKNQNNYKEEIRYYIAIFVTYLHEILGHVLVILQRNLYDRNIKSPETKGNMYSKSSNKRGYESGEYLHVKLFGKLLKALSLEEVCFLFDIKNYKEKDYLQFQKKFLNCRNKQYSIPDILEDLINHKKINVEKFGEINLNIYLSNEKDNFIINLLDEDTRICNILEI
jgi:hypothetical protein